MGVVWLAHRARERADRHPVEEDGQGSAAGGDPRARARVQGHPGGGAAGRTLLPQPLDVGVGVREDGGHPRRQVRRPRAQVRQGPARGRSARPRGDARHPARGARHRQAPHQPLRLRGEALRRHHHQARPRGRGDGAHGRRHPRARRREGRGHRHRLPCEGRREGRLAAHPQGGHAPPQPVRLRRLDRQHPEPALRVERGGRDLLPHARRLHGERRGHARVQSGGGQGGAPLARGGRHGRHPAEDRPARGARFLAHRGFEEERHRVHRGRVAPGVPGLAGEVPEGRVQALGCVAQLRADPRHLRATGGGGHHPAARAGRAGGAQDRAADRAGEVEGRTGTPERARQAEQRARGGGDEVDPGEDRRRAAQRRAGDRRRGEARGGCARAQGRQGRRRGEADRGRGRADGGGGAHEGRGRRAQAGSGRLRERKRLRAREALREDRAEAPRRGDGRCTRRDLRSPGQVLSAVRSAIPQSTNPPISQSHNPPITKSPTSSTSQQKGDAK